jgi:hypothetical protein
MEMGVVLANLLTLRGDRNVLIFAGLLSALRSTAALFTSRDEGPATIFLVSAEFSDGVIWDEFFVRLGLNSSGELSQQEVPFL